MFVSRILAIAAAVAAIAPAAVAAAPVSDDTVLTRQVHVRTGDLNLASIAGKRALQSRITRAISQVCSLSDMPETSEKARCRQVARADARQQVTDVLNRTTSRYAQAASAPAPTTTASGS